MGLLGKQERSTSAEVATKALYNAIVDGVIEPGSFLRLQDLSDQLSMSMMPVREAIRELASLGLVEMIPHRGAQVRPLDLKDLVDTYRARLYLETRVLRVAVPKFGEKDARAARDALDQRAIAYAQGDAVTARAAHERFHFAIYRAADNEWLVNAITPGWRNSERYRSSSMRLTNVRERHDSEHQALLDAMSNHDAEQSVRILYGHLASAANSVANQLAGKDIWAELPAVEELL
ncbi:GntR family transcriptional regulator [Paenarthrobacter sp. NPDC056912]|uniref:GntR family transcriptional regulator n=1 Tax=Paenarthrobacter sp. NPDC056912 TaxID=3345965 RepID=UPI0036711E4E